VTDAIENRNHLVDLTKGFCKHDYLIEEDLIFYNNDEKNYTWWARLANMSDEWDVQMQKSITDEQLDSGGHPIVDVDVALTALLEIQRFFTNAVRVFGDKYLLVSNKGYGLVFTGKISQFLKKDKDYFEQALSPSF